MDIWNSCSRIDFSGIVEAKWSAGDFQIPDRIQQRQQPSSWLQVSSHKTGDNVLYHIVVKYFWNNLFWPASESIIQAPALVPGIPYIKLDTRQNIEHKNILHYSVPITGKSDLGFSCIWEVYCLVMAKQDLKAPRTGFILCWLEQLCRPKELARSLHWPAHRPAPEYRTCHRYSSDAIPPPHISQICVM